MKIRNIPLLYISAICLSLASCNSSPKNSLILVTQVPGGITNPEMNSTGSWRHIPGSQIVALNPEKPGYEKLLTGDFHSACYPEISYDGRYMLFSAKENEGDPWQIFEMEIRKGEARIITSSKADCLDPVYLPAGRMAFTKYTVNDTVKSALCLYAGNLDGTNISQITFGPSDALATSVLNDGRLLTVSRNLIPETGGQMFTVMRPDGTKADMFYKGAPGSSLLSRPRETHDGRIIFIEKGDGNHSEGDLVSITYNRPLYSRINLTADIEGDFISALPLLSGRMLVSYHRPGTGKSVLCEFDPAERSVGKVLYENDEYNVADAVLAVKYERPKKLPSEVDMGVRTGLLLCQDVNFTGFHPAGANTGTPHASMVEILGIDSTYGAVPVEIDGSIYLKIIADTPFRIRTLDKNGRVIDGSCTWLWVRPNERRGCVGCHEDPETVPKNRIPEAVKKDPYIIPVHITEIKEKTVELE